jgi:uncharacterized cupredoxin-like copper-binding protein
MSMNASPYFLGRWVHIASLLALSLLLLVPAIAAQDDANEAHPAHIHSGTCDQLGDVVLPLGDVVTQTGEEMGAAGGHPVKVSEVNRVEVPLQEILDGGHAINVHLSAEEIGTYIACGNIGGIVHERENGEGMEITIALAELNDSGHTGIAWLGDDGEGGTNVAISLIEPDVMSSPGGAAAEATPVAGAGGETVAVSLTEFMVDMPSELPAGPTTFEITNDGTIEHNFEVEGQGIEEELPENLAPGASGTLKVDLAPGTYEVYCPVGNHADEGMRLELTVT